MLSCIINSISSLTSGVNMDEKIIMNKTNDELTAAFAPNSASASATAKRDRNSGEVDLVFNNTEVSKKSQGKFKKSYLAMIIGGIVGIIGGAICIVVALLQPENESAMFDFPEVLSTTTTEQSYSVLTGEVLADASKKDAPIYCIQTPNGTDGARPQAGLTEAGVVFEAVAEAGITRFAAIYQNPTSAIIGPIRSLRLYYLQWDTPFDCTIVHAGGADDALSAVSVGGYKDLSEDYSYMYRGTYSGRLWNNLFTTSAQLEQFSTDRGYTNSAGAKGFTRMTPEESKRARVDNLAIEKLDIVTPTTGDTSALKPTVDTIAFRFGDWASFNVRYNYDATANRYLRSYESGATHDVYSCTSEYLGEKNPEDVCTLTQMSPAVVIAMIVQESRASDNYHEDITTVGSGDAYIFQNGTAIKGRWNKDSVASQIMFTDESGAEVKLAPGQTFISAVPRYGNVSY